MDLGFVLDKSSSVNSGHNGGSNFLKVLAFVKKAAEKYGICQNGVKASVLTFSDHDKIRLNIKFNDCNDKACFTKAVNRIDSVPRGLTYLNLALKKAKEEMFNKNNGHRSNVPAYLILIADGGQTNKSLEQEAIDTAKYLKTEMDIKFIAFGIGIKQGSHAETFLKELADDNYYYVASFSYLDTYLEGLMQSVCRGM